MDQDACIATLHPMMSPELARQPAAAEAAKRVSDAFVSLRGALAYCALTQVWILAYIVALQRVPEPTKTDIRRLNAVTRKLQRGPKTLVFPVIHFLRGIDILGDNGYRRIRGTDDDVKGYGVRGVSVLRRGQDHKGQARVHLVDAICKLHRIRVSSSYGAEGLDASRAVDNAYPTPVSLQECSSYHCHLDSRRRKCFQKLVERQCQNSSGKVVLVHVAWLHEMLYKDVIRTVQWCDTHVTCLQMAIQKVVSIEQH